MVLLDMSFTYKQKIKLITFQAESFNNMTSYILKVTQFYFYKIQMSGSRTVDHITSQLEQEEKMMYIHQKNGCYVDAEKSRLKIEQLQKDLEARTLLEMDWRHKRQQNDLTKSNNDELLAFNTLMDQKMNEINQEAEKAEHNLIAKHQQQLENLRKNKEAEYSTTVKESSELLNLRSMEQSSVKQSKYDQAHKIQQKIFQLEKEQKQSWMEKRAQKIQTALNTLKAKQNVQLANLRKRFKTLLDQLQTERKIEEERLLKKHQNFHKDLKSQQQKQILNYKGEFRSKGGRDSPLRTKSSFTN